MSGLKARIRVIVIACLLVLAFFLYAFWPRAVHVDMGEIARAAMMVTIDEEARTRVRNAYVVSTPIAGRLLRIDVEPGDGVSDGQAVARMTPADPGLIDVRSEEQAKAAVEAAQAALAAAQAGIEQAQADAAFMRGELERTQTLFERDQVSRVALDNAQRASRTANAALDAARATLRMREADLDNARAILMSYADSRRLAMSTNPHPREIVEVSAPVSGRILRVMQESEAVLPAGTPILEIGDPAGDLEIVADLLSADAVRVEEGDRVIIEDWGGGDTLAGEVERIEPWGFTKYSALGVEEQRVRVLIRFDGDPAMRERLGHGFRVETRIVIWEDPASLTIPANAIFRHENGWAAFAVEDGRARLTPVVIGENNGVEAQILDGLEEGDSVILFPGNAIEDGLLVRRRQTE